jgi:hypothetical protein
MKPQRTIFHTRVARCDLQKKRIETRYTELVFLHSVQSVGHSAFWCIHAMKCRCTIFHVGVGLEWIPQKVRRDTLR